MTSECSAMKSQLTFTPEVLTFCTLNNHCDYYLTLLVIYERLNILKNDRSGLNGHEQLKSEVYIHLSQIDLKSQFLTIPDI